jgi:cellulose synthase/poly-beta-1,6-N-acetylglucosamine synthase-like glycosyltransferase
VTIVSNGCRKDVRDFLDQEYSKKWIDQLVINAENRGKVDALISVARGCYERLITFADADVLFAPRWIDAVCKVFHHFPECGAVLQPNPVMYKRHTTATLLGALVSREIGSAAVVPERDLDQFASSIGRPDFYQEEHKAAQMIVRRNDFAACVGGGHFAFTIRREILAGVPDAPSLHPLGQYGIEHWMDVPADRLGFWRLATHEAYAYHMGNVPEPWMYEELERCRRVHQRAPRSPYRRYDLPDLRRPWTSRVSYGARRFAVRVMRRMGLFRMYASEAS